MKEHSQFDKRRFRTIQGRLCLALAVGGLVAPTAGMAQGAAQDKDAGAYGGDSSPLEEILVTARRRTENLSEVPISITAFNSAQIEERSIRTDSDLQASVPGLTIRQTQGNNSLTYAIRGQSADTFSGSPSAVVAYLDEVPMSISGASTFYDLESIQVLKGPQGTLFGRNTTGGAVLYTTAKPTNELGGKLQVRGGNYDLQEAQGMINAPLVDDKLLLRAAFDTVERDGYIDNLLNGDELGKVNRDSGRAALTFRPNDRLDNTTVFSYSKARGTNTGASYTYSVYQYGQTNNGFTLNPASGSLFGPGLDAAVSSPGAWDAYLAAHPQAYAPGLIAYVDEQKRLGYYKTRHPGGAKHKGEDWLGSNTTVFELNDDYQIKNILGGSHAKTDSEQPQLGAPFVTILTANAATGKSGNEQKNDSLSDELQLNGSALNDDLTYIAGIYLQTQKSDTLWPQTYFDVSPIIPPSYATNNFRIETDTYAVYSQGDYTLGSLTGIENLSVTAGLRYTWEDVSIEQLPGADAYGAAKQDTSFSDPSWELGLEYDVSDSTFTYLKTRGSFRSGGYNGSAQPIDADATGGGNHFDSETTEDVEAGLKFLGDVFDRPATLNVAVYHQWIDDVQRVEFPDPDGAGPIASIAVTANVPKMEVDGVEVQVTIEPIDWLVLGLSGAYTDAKFKDGDVNLFGSLYSYGPVANTPEQTGVAWAQINVPVGAELGEVSFYSEIYSQSSMYFSNTADSIGPDTKLPSYDLVNARLSWTNMFGSKFSTALFGKNLTDEEYFVGGMSLAAALGHNAAAVGEPLTYGAELTYEF
ncbi:MAG TPA: TonB-dependent receptor plug domain-containing protein [Halioglobus sp.]